MACPKNLEKVCDIEIFCNIANFWKIKAKNDRVPTFFYVLKFFLCFFQKNIENVGTLLFLPCFFEIFIRKKYKYRHFSMSQTFSKFFLILEKVWDTENFRKIKAKTTESQHFSMLKGVFSKLSGNLIVAPIFCFFS